MTTELIIQYCVYGGIIVVGIVILLLMHRKNKLPNQTELKSMVVNWQNRMREFAENERKGAYSNFEFFRRLSKLLYRLEKLSYLTSRMAQKARDMELSSVAQSLESADRTLLPYKAAKDKGGVQEAVAAALGETEKAVRTLDAVMQRESAYKARKKKQNG